MDTMIIALGITALFLVQSNLPKSKHKVAGLLLPIAFLILSFVLVFKVNGYIEVYGKIVELLDPELIILKSLGMLMFLNVPTMVFLTIYYRDENDSDNGLKETNRSS